MSKIDPQSILDPLGARESPKSAHEVSKSGPRMPDSKKNSKRSPNKANMKLKTTPKIKLKTDTKKKTRK